jgi:hypothetical protein
MPENTSLNSADGVPPDVERILSKLEAEPLAVNRDELFFQAGHAAGSCNRTSRFLWPSAAAALLLVSVSLAAALAHQIIRSDLAPGQALAVNQAPPQPLAASAPATAELSVPADSRSQLRQRLASATILPRGRLTAIGWLELPDRVDSGQSAAGSEDSAARSQGGTPHGPSTYLELMRSQNKG